MLKITLLATFGAVVTSAQLLDIPGLLGGLGPAPDNDPRFTTFTPPGHNDGKPAIVPSDSICGESILIHRVVRSPCPGLVRIVHWAHNTQLLMTMRQNALANHGFIHHDGRNMTVPHLLEGLAAGLNVGADFSVAVRDRRVQPKMTSETLY